MFDIMRTCPRTGRLVYRKQKLFLYIALTACAMYGVVLFTYPSEIFAPLRPLANAESEARRLIKFITHYHLHCNVTSHVGNLSYWPICNEKEFGIDIDNKDDKLAYFVGSYQDRAVEKALAFNYSFQSYIISHEPVPLAIYEWNNTHVLKTSIVPNDYADFSRNTYGQQTLNNLIRSLGHDRLTILRIANVASNVNIWEILHFMIFDNLLLNVDQLHFSMYIDKLDEDLLYNWYRVLWDLFYKQGFRLYHTASHDSLCLQVTMMESCRYYLSWVKNPGARQFILHPPADIGSRIMEEYRLRKQLSQQQVSCPLRDLEGQESTLAFMSEQQTMICQGRALHKERRINGLCSVVNIRENVNSQLVNPFPQCGVFTLEPVSSQSPLTNFHQSHAIRWYTVMYRAPNTKGSLKTRTYSADETLQLTSSGEIRLLQIQAPAMEWLVLRQLLNSGVMENVTQAVAHFEVPGGGLGAHPTDLRSAYSDLRRLEAFGLRLVHSSPLAGGRVRAHKPTSDTCCYATSYVQTRLLRRDY